MVRVRYGVPELFHNILVGEEKSLKMQKTKISLEQHEQAQLDHYANLTKVNLYNELYDTLITKRRAQMAFFRSFEVPPLNHKKPQVKMKLTRRQLQKAWRIVERAMHPSTTELQKSHLI